MESDGQFPNGLGALVRRLRLNQSALARSLDTDRQNVSRWVKGQRKIPQDVATHIARLLGVPVTEILFEDGGGIVSAPLVSWVSAGNLQDIGTVASIDDAPRVIAPDLPTGEWVALKVEGDSMDRISPPDSIIFVNIREKRLIPNACYILADEEGRATYKRYRPDPQRFEPVSVNGAHEPIFVTDDTMPTIIGRVRKSILSL